MTNTIRRDSLIIRERQRTVIHKPPLNELKESILGPKGLLHPPAVWPMGDGKYLLIAGERRTKAIDLIAGEGKFYQCDGQTWDPKQGDLPVTLCTVETLLQAKEAELEENILREPLTWQDQARALAEIHKLREEQNPGQTVVATAKELVDKGAPVASADSLRKKITESVLIAKHLANPAIAQARSASEAHTLVLKQEHEKIQAALVKKRLAASKDTPPEVIIRQGNCLEILPKLDVDLVDLILVDPPYGIGASDGGFRSRTVHHHNYEDEPDVAKAIMRMVLTEGFRITKNRANLFMFTDIKWWDWLQNISAQIGWTPFRRPMLWGKSDSEGLAPWGSAGPRITTEFIFYATKGQKGLLASPIDYQRVDRVSRSERIHAAEKPVELLKKLIECSTLPGDFILDPCCGSGSTLVAAKELRRRGLGIEKDENFFNTAMANVHGEK